MSGRAWCGAARPSVSTLGWGLLRLLLAACLLGLNACAHQSGKELQLQDHPLAGRIWDVRGAGFVDPTEVIARLRESPIILLGEIHDNPEHHRIQTRLFDALTANGQVRALVMEQFDAEHQAQMDVARRSADASADSIASAGKLNRDGWNWPLYEPLVALALARDMPIAGANLSRTEARQVAASGFGVLGEDRVRRLPLDATWSEERDKVMGDIIAAGHCGQLPDSVVPGIIRAQRARDALMADVAAGYAQTGAVVILGRGHARRDIGVPLYLSRLVPATDVAVVGLVEVQEGLQDPGAYQSIEAGIPGSGGAYDYLWFTARAPRKDPCAGFSAAKLLPSTGAR